MRYLSYVLVITVLLLGSMLVAQSNDSRGSDIHFLGPVAAIESTSDGTPIRLTVQVNRSTVQVQLTAWTQYAQGRGLSVGPSEIGLGDFIEVNGFFTGSGKIVARQIHLENSDEVGVEGIIEDVAGNAFRVHGIDFHLNEESRIHAAGDSDEGEPVALQAGMLVRIRANHRNGQLVVHELEYGPRTVEAVPLRFEGWITKIDGQLLSVDVGIRFQGQAIDALVAFDDETVFIGSIHLGDYVEVEGRFLPGSSLVRASQVVVDENENGNTYDEDPGEPPEFVSFEQKGVVQGINKSQSGMVSQFYLGDTLIHVNGETKVFFQDSTEASLADLEIGQEVNVEGIKHRDGMIRAEEIEICSLPPDPEDEQVELEGTVSGISKNPEGAVTEFNIHGTLVRVTSETIITMDGVTVTSSEIRSGLYAYVKGMEQSDGSVLADEIELEEKS